MALHYAALGGYENIALPYTSQDDYKDCVQLLLDYGASIHLKNHDEYTPEEIALQNGHTNIANLIFKLWVQKCQTRFVI